jgi:hypothetical protein
MNELENTKQTKREYWKDQIQKWQDSNLSQAKFCSQEGIKLNTFGYWRGIISSSKNNKTKNFASIQIIKDIDLQCDHKIEIKLTSGHVVYLPLKIGIDEISKIIKSFGLSHA